MKVNQKVSIITLSALMLNTFISAELLAAGKKRGGRAKSHRAAAVKRGVATVATPATTATTASADTTTVEEPATTTTTNNTSSTYNITNVYNGTVPESDDAKTARLALEAEQAQELAKQKAEQKKARESFNTAYETARSECSGISSGLQAIQTLAGVSVGVNTVGTLAAGTATAVGFYKYAKYDKQKTTLDDWETFQGKVKTLNDTFMGDCISEDGTVYGKNPLGNTTEDAEIVKRCAKIAEDVLELIEPVKEINGEISSEWTSLDNQLDSSGLTNKRQSKEAKKEAKSSAKIDNITGQMDSLKTQIASTTDEKAKTALEDKLKKLDGDLYKEQGVKSNINVRDVDGAFITTAGHILSKLTPENDDQKSQMQNQYNSLRDQLAQGGAPLSEEDANKAKKLGTIRTVALAGATATSATSIGTSFASMGKADDLKKKMESCNTAITKLQEEHNKLIANEIPDTDPLVIKGRQIISNCAGFDTGNMTSIANTMKTSGIVSSIGTGTAAAGTVTSVLAGSKKVTDHTGQTGENLQKAIKKEKGLNMASNILAGVTTGTSAASLVLSGVVLSKLNNDADKAKACEESFTY